MKELSTPGFTPVSQSVAYSVYRDSFIIFSCFKNTFYLFTLYACVHTGVYASMHVCARCAWYVREKEIRGGVGPCVPWGPSGRQEFASPFTIGIQRPELRIPGLVQCISCWLSLLPIFLFLAVSSTNGGMACEVTHVWLRVWHTDDAHKYVCLHPGRTETFASDSIGNQWRGRV